MNITGLFITLAALITGGVVGMVISDNDDNQSMNAVYGMQNEHVYEDSLPLAEDFVSSRPYVVGALPIEELSSEEIEDLTFMREEEKLARDVYTTLYEKWGTPIFSNIAQSEQTHTEAIRELIEKYSITDPITNDEIGVFVNETLAGLYDSLVEQGSVSLVEALKVGTTIEDLDIKDLKEALLRTDNKDITVVFENLQRGSRNHLRSFVSQLEAQGGEYTSQYISEEDYKAIVSTDRERGDGASKGGAMNGSNERGHGGGRTSDQSGSGRSRGWGGNY